VIAEFKGGDLKKKVSMKNFKARVKELREKAGIKGKPKEEPKKEPKKESKKEPKEEPKEEPKKNLYGAFGKKLLDDGMEEHVVKELYDHTNNAFAMLSETSDLSAKDLVKFYNTFDDNLSEADSKYIIQFLTDGESEVSAKFDDFADAMYNNLGRKEVFGNMFDMCAKGEEMTLDELRTMLKQLGEEEKNERNLFLIHEKCKKRDDFIKFWSETLTDIVAPKAAPPIPKSNVGAATSKSSSSSSSSSSKKSNSSSSEPKPAPKTSGGGGGGADADAMKKDPKYKKYFKLVKLLPPGVGKGAAKQKMEQDGLSPDLIEKLAALL